MDKQVELGQQMWLMLADAFREVAREGDALTHAEKARVWSGFLASAAGAMAHDLGKPDAIAILAAVTDAAMLAPPAPGSYN
jgi:hypothetical protein